MREYIMQNRYLIYAVLGGGVLVMTLVLTYLAYWRPREERDRRREREEGVEIEPAHRFGPYLPWVLTLTYAAIFLYGILYTIYLSRNPPNW